VLATLAGKLITAKRVRALAAKSTLNRLEHPPLTPSRYHKIGHDAAAIEGLFVAVCCTSHRSANSSFERQHQDGCAPRPRHRRYDARSRPPLVPPRTVPAVDPVYAGGLVQP
jgi:hypothetical protein